jgi:hypothetical protein
MEEPQAKELEELVNAATGIMASQRLSKMKQSALVALVRMAYELGRRQPMTGADFTEGAYEGEESCGCGEPITFFEGGWMHIVSEKLRGTGDHYAEPAGGYYVPAGMGEDEDE